jgi:uncharacterized protein YjbJ (UPF0337 family)
MNEDVLKGHWKELKGLIRTQWGKLTDDDVAKIAGDRDMLIGRLQARYGRSREEFERELDAWVETKTREEKSVR